MPTPTIPCRCNKEGAQCMIHNPPFPIPDKGKKIRYKDLAKTDEPAYLKLWQFYSDRGMKIPRGIEVIPTDWAYQNGVANKHDQIRYFKVRNCTDGFTICVHKSTNKQPTRYWSGFWKQKKIKS